MTNYELPKGSYRRIRIATYNVHGWVGTDNRQVPARVIRVISDIDADIIALQEATFSLEKGGHLDESFFIRFTGMRVVLGPTFLKKPFHFGNVLLSRFPLKRIRYIDLSTHPYEPRGAIDAVVTVGNHHIRVMNAHLGLRGTERKYQADMLVRALSAEPHDPVILMGDFNEWSPRCSTLRNLYSLFTCKKNPRTFPSFFPLFSLDRILVSPTESLEKIKALNTTETIIASDHLPVVAVVAL